VSGGRAHRAAAATLDSLRSGMPHFRFWRSIQPVTVRSNMRRAEASITDRNLHHYRETGVYDYMGAD
jgi:hypothetical protein